MARTWRTLAKANYRLGGRGAILTLGSETTPQWAAGDSDASNCDNGDELA
jgi:hypothetical protein